MWLSAVGPLLVINIFSYFFVVFFWAYFQETKALLVQHQCQFIRTGSDVNLPSVPVYSVGSNSGSDRVF